MGELVATVGDGVVGAEVGLAVGALEAWSQYSKRELSGYNRPSGKAIVVMRIPKLKLKHVASKTPLQSAADDV